MLAEKLGSVATLETLEPYLLNHGALRQLLSNRKKLWLTPPTLFCLYRVIFFSVLKEKQLQSSNQLSLFAFLTFN